MRFWADNFDPVIVHLKRARQDDGRRHARPFCQAHPYRDRMGWSFERLSSGGSAFNANFGVYFEPAQQDERVYNYGTIAPGLADREGLSVFCKDDSGAVFHTYSAYARGIGLVNTAYNYLDLVPRGRDEEGKPPQYWVRRHHSY